MSERRGRKALPSIPTPTCPRCTSDRTKFCYYNNYSVLQPRYYCKDCRRYWTHGGALRNIPSGGTRRKRAVVDMSSSSSSSRSLRPPDNPVGAVVGLNIGGSTYRPSISETIQAINGGGYFNQTPNFMFSPGGVNTVSAGFGCGAPSTPLLPQFSSYDNFQDVGFPFVQQSQYQPPATTGFGLASQNMVLNNASTTVTTPNCFLSTSRDSSASANVVSINDWTELTDMEPLQSYNPPSP